MTHDQLKQHLVALLNSLKVDAGVDTEMGTLFICPACGIADEDRGAIALDDGECANCNDGTIQKLITVKLLDPES